MKSPFRIKDWQLKNSKQPLVSIPQYTEVIDLYVNPNKVYNLCSQITGTVSSTQKKEFNFEDNYGGYY
jgi:hypothetical protein